MADERFHNAGDTVCTPCRAECDRFNHNSEQGQLERRAFCSCLERHEEGSYLSRVILCEDILVLAVAALEKRESSGVDRTSLGGKGWTS